MKIQLAKLSMEGATIHWFNIWRESTDEISWESFKEALTARFGKGRLDNPYEELKELQQRGTVNDYIAELELHSSLCGKLPELQYLGYFIGGLRSEIKNRVRTLRPKNRYQAMQVACDVEIELWPEEDDADRNDNRPNVVGPFPRQPRVQSRSRWVVGLGLS